MTCLARPPTVNNCCLGEEQHDVSFVQGRLHHAVSSTLRASSGVHEVTSADATDGDASLYSVDFKIRHKPSNF